MGRVGLLRSAKENTLFMFDSHVSCNLKKGSVVSWAYFIWKKGLDFTCLCLNSMCHAIFVKEQVC